MLKKMLAAVFSLGLLGTQMALADVAEYDVKPRIEHYAAKPFLLSSYSTPMVMMVLAKDHKMFYRAYNNLVDLNNDLTVDIGFNPAITYYGYFDSYSCYTYKNEKFIRSGAAKAQNSDEAKAVRQAAGIPMDIQAPASYTGLCNFGGNKSEWSGNWLNYAMTSRMDAIRKVLYGGKRSEASDGDTLGTASSPSITVLEHSYIPPDAHVWGVEVPSDNLWPVLTPFSPYYDISSFTPYAKPSSGTGLTTAQLLYFARVSDSQTKASRLLVATKVPHVYKSGVNYTNTPYEDVPESSKWRLWDWALGETPMPNNNNLNNGKVVTTYRARVQVCDLKNLGQGEVEGCRLYSPGNNKPVGLMQKYGDQNDMLFGLITGSYGKESRYRGGVLRQHIQSIDDSIDGDGRIKRGKAGAQSLVQTIDDLRITGWPKNNDGTDKVGGSYESLTTFRNPLGEMVYEAVRYFAGKESGTSAYSPGSKEDDLTLPLLTDWSKGGPTIDCATPIIMAISDVYPEFDSDDVPGSPFKSFGSSDIKTSEVPPLSTIKGQSFGSFDMAVYLDKVTRHEGYAGQTFFYGQKKGDKSRPDCSPKTLTSLAEIRGLCPADPIREGSYSVVAAAYYGHTHDFSGQVEGQTEQLNRPIDFYSVAMTSAFPPMQFNVGGKSLTFMPIGSAKNGTSYTWDKSFLGFINYFITDWQTDEVGELFQATIIVNFEDRLEGADYERDGLAIYRLTLLTDKAASNGTTEPLGPAGRNIIINSGEFIGSENSVYCYKNIMGTATTPGTKARIDPSRVVGFLVETDVSGTTAGFSMMFGYTINGTTRDHTYLDAAHNGANHGKKPSGRWTANGLPIDTNDAPFIISDRIDDPNGTPWGCLEPGGSGCKKSIPYRQTRAFKLAKTSSKASFLPDPLWLAAKYGGFIDSNDNGLPDEGEWEKFADTVGTAPINYFLVTNMNSLSYQLEAAFEAASRTTSTGTATSASVNSVLGGGLSIQTLYHTEYTEPGSALRRSITWPGNVYGFFVDRWGNMRENSYTANEAADGTKMLDLATGPMPGNNILTTTGDLVVDTIDVCAGYGYESRCNANGTLNPPSICSDEQIRAEIRRYWDAKGTNEFGDPCQNGRPNYMVVDSVEDLEVVWNASQLLAEVSDEKVTTSRTYNNPDGGRLALSYYPMEQLEKPESDGWNPSNGPLALDVPLFRFNETKNVELAPWLLMINTSSTWAIRSKSNPNTCSTIQVEVINADLPSGVSEVDLKIVPVMNSSQAPRVVVTTSIHNSTMHITLTCHNGKNLGQSVQPKDLMSVINYGANPSLPLRAWMPDDSNSCKGNNWFIDQDFTAESISVPDAEAAKRLINYILGVDRTDFRPRRVANPWSASPATITWRLSDVINSKPVIVGQPANNFDLHYGDPSYWTYKKERAARRQVAYFGSNGGLLHAVNMGFYGSLKDGQAGYMEQPNNLKIGETAPPAHKLGAELWAYVPTAVLPHLQWLSRTDYDHSYYVDLTPQVADIKNTGSALGAGDQAWAKDAWKTVLIGGLRLGGRTILAPEQFYNDKKQRYSYSEFFALDVTDPEQPPNILWRFSVPELGLSTSEPAVVSSNGKWYVVIASGPNYDEPDGTDGTTGRPGSDGVKAYDGFSYQNARVFVLDAVTGQRVKTLVLGRAEDEVKVDPKIGPKSFFNSTFAPVAFNEASMVKYANDGSVTWTNPAVYLGVTTSRESDTALDRGALYRVQMVDTNGQALPVNDWKLARLINTDRPVTGAVNMTYDNNQNIWVTFGTGRLWSRADATDICGQVSPPAGASDSQIAAMESACDENHHQYLYGVKEPLNKGNPTFAEVSQSDLYDVSGYTVYGDGQMTWQEDEVTKTGTYYNLSVRLASDAYPGYKRRLDTLGLGRYEMIVTQPKIEGLSNGESLLAVTTYEPSQRLCQAEGRSYLLLADSFTGLPAPYMGSLDLVPGSSTNADGAEAVSGYITAGPGQSTEAYILHTDEGVQIGATGQNSSNHKVDMKSEKVVTSGAISWREVLDMGFSMSLEQMQKGLGN